MIRNLLKIKVVLFFLMSFNAFSQEIIGNWETYDDSTGEKKAIVEIYKSDNKYFGRILKKFVGKNTICEKCTGVKKNKPIIGLIILENLKLKDGKYQNGTITDPENGNVYSCNVEIISENKLKIRGFIGFSLFGRTQYWKRQLK